MGRKCQMGQTKLPRGIHGTHHGLMWCLAIRTDNQFGILVVRQRELDRPLEGNQAFIRDAALVDVIVPFRIDRRWWRP